MNPAQFLNTARDLEQKRGVEYRHQRHVILGTKQPLAHRPQPDDPGILEENLHLRHVGHQLLDDLSWLAGGPPD